MPIADFLQIFALAIEFFGAIILTIPLIRKNHDLNDELVIDLGKGKNGEDLWTRQGFLRDRKKGLWGLGLLGAGFLLQLIATILKLQNS